MGRDTIIEGVDVPGEIAMPGQPTGPYGTIGGEIIRLVEKKRGRPKVHPDRKAYKAQKERERRAKLKAEGK